MNEKAWQYGILNEWSICGMNHYHVNGEKFLFVSMVKDGLCITQEGRDDQYLWNRLWHKANELNTRTSLKEELIENISKTTLSNDDLNEVIEAIKEVLGK